MHGGGARQRNHPHGRTKEDQTASCSYATAEEKQNNQSKKGRVPYTP